MQNKYKFVLLFGASILSFICFVIYRQPPSIHGQTYSKAQRSSTTRDDSARPKKEHLHTTQEWMGVTAARPVKEDIKDAVEPKKYQPENVIDPTVAPPDENAFPIQGKSSISRDAPVDERTDLHEDTYRPVHRMEFKYIMEPINGTCGQDTVIVLMVCSSFENLARRETIRRTWGTAMNVGKSEAIVVLFVIGLPQSAHEHMQDLVLMEGLANGDIVQGDFVDAYQNLTHKSLAAQRWVVSHCGDVRYYMKTDDDVYVNTLHLLDLLMSTSSDYFHHKEDIIWGYRFQNAKPISLRNSKYYVPPALYKGKSYPDYLSGFAYLMPMPLATKLYRAASGVSLFWLEDVFITGVLGRKLNVTLVHDNRFIYKRLRHYGSPCFYKNIIAAHEISVTDLYHIWKSVKFHVGYCSGRNRDIAHAYGVSL